MAATAQLGENLRVLIWGSMGMVTPCIYIPSPYWAKPVLGASLMELNQFTKFTYKYALVTVLNSYKVGNHQMVSYMLKISLETCVRFRGHTLTHVQTTFEPFPQKIIAPACKLSRHSRDVSHVWLSPKNLPLRSSREVSWKGTPVSSACINGLVELEHLQESMVFAIKYGGFLWIFTSSNSLNVGISKGFMTQS